MKKIAFIDTGFTGSTLPLIKQFIDRGCQVDLYELGSSHIIKEEAFTFKEIPCHSAIGEVPLEYYEHMRDYLDFSKFRFMYLSVMRPFASVPLLRSIVHWPRIMRLRQIAKKLNKENYDMVNFISKYWDEDYIPLIENIDGTKIVSLHEVCNHYNPDFDHTPPLLKTVFTKQIPIVVFSDKSKDDILKYKDVTPHLVHDLRFGCFETYKYMLRNTSIDMGENYFLFFGHLKPYKGVATFAQAIRIIHRKRKDIKFVIAGKGHDDSLDAIKDNPNVSFLNKYIENDELAHLLQHAYAVVCPHKTASQSGIPQTCFVFGKPIIASALGSFKEIIGNDQFGLLTEPESAEALADAIIRLWENKNLYNELTDNIANFEQLRKEYSWHEIANAYQEIFA